MTPITPGAWGAIDAKDLSATPASPPSPEKGDVAGVEDDPVLRAAGGDNQEFGPVDLLAVAFDVVTRIGVASHRHDPMLGANIP